MRRFQPRELAVVDESDKHRGHIGSRPGGETHFRIVITADAFVNMNRLERHRQVYAALADELRGGVHALAIEARAPGEPGRPSRGPSPGAKP